MEIFKKDITAEGFAVNFLLNDVDLYFEDAHEKCLNLLSEENGEILIFTFDKGYYAVGKRVKDVLIQNGKKVSCFCLDYGANLNGVLKKILSEIGDFSTVIAVDNLNLAVNLKSLICDKTQFIYLPLDFEFGAFLCERFCKNSKVIFDKTVFNNLKKNKILSGIKSVLAKRIITAEMCVYQLIDGFFDENELLLAFEEGQENLRKYFKKADVKLLLLSQCYCSCLISKLPVSFNPLYCSLVAGKLCDSADESDLEFTFYKILLKIYYLYLNNNIDFIAKLPDIISEKKQLEKLGFTVRESFHDYLFNLQKTSAIKSKLLSDNNLKDIILEQINLNASVEKTFKKIYAGRKYTVEHYGEKERAKSISLALLLSDKNSLLKVIWADGVLQYFNWGLIWKNKFQTIKMQSK